jgi:two-component system, cell cycle sensor histidine kinase and response regulator CckA
MPLKSLLRDRDKKFRFLFEDNPQPMWIVDPITQNFLEINQAASKLYGYSAQEFRGLALADVDLESPPAIDLLAEQGQPAARRHRTKSGRVIDVEVAVYEIDYGGRPALLMMLMDITGRRQLEEQLRQAQKMEAVGMLAGGVAHDFNNLLTIITGYSQLILNNLKEKDPNRHSAEQIMKAGERAAALTKQLLAFSRRQVLQLRVVDLNKLVTSMGAMLQRLIGEDIDLRLSLKPDLGRVSADPSQIEQVIMNLVVNARDAMPKGGVLTLETSNTELDSGYAHRHIAVKPGPYVMLAVSDNGSGMDSATRARLFEPFFTTKGSGKGTGLGLSTVFGIVKQSGGSVDVYSEMGKGTSFKIYLPRIDQPAAVEPESLRKVVRRGWETVLLVEDDEMVRTLVRETLEGHGYKVLDAGGPLEARRMAEHFPGPIHLIITDVVMPKVNGRELAQQIMRRRGDMRVLYMSGYTDNAVLNSGILAGDVAFLQKPFTPGALIEKVRDVLEGDERSRSASE